MIARQEHPREAPSRAVVAAMLRAIDQKWSAYQMLYPISAEDEGMLAMAGRLSRDEFDTIVQAARAYAEGHAGASENEESTDA